MTPIQQVAYETVKTLQEKCIAEHRAPVCVSMNDIQRSISDQIKTVLNGFIADGTMIWHKNVNGIPMFKIEKPID